MPHKKAHHTFLAKMVDGEEEETRIKTLDHICGFFSIAMPLTTLPQIIKIYVEKDVAGISLLYWVLYTISCIPFLLYGIVHKAKPVAILNLSWIIVNLVIIAGILLYR